MFYPALWPLVLVPARPSLPVRMALLPRPVLPPRSAVYSGVSFPPLMAGGGPVYGRLDPFQSGTAVIDPGELFFRAGNPVGGPSESFRGVSASQFPQYASVTGPGAPLAPGAFGLAGARLVAPQTGGAAWPL
jgi:hypothetical protein